MLICWLQSCKAQFQDHFYLVYMLTTGPETGTQMNANYSVIFAHGKVGNDVAAKLTSATAKISIGFQSLA